MRRRRVQGTGYPGYRTFLGNLGTSYPGTGEYGHICVDLYQPRIAGTTLVLF